MRAAVTPILTQPNSMSTLTATTAFTQPNTHRTPTTPFQFTLDEMGFVFLKSFVCAFLKKASLDELNEFLKVEQSALKRFTAETLVVLAFSLLCAQLFGYSFFFSLALESTNHILRRTGNSHWTFVSGPAFYAPGLIINMLNNPKPSETPILWHLTERALRSGASGLGGLAGWLMAIGFEPGVNMRKARRKQQHQTFIERIKKSIQGKSNEALPTSKHPLPAPQ